MFRQTKDIDFLGEGISNAEDNLKKIIGEISKIKYEDGLVYNIGLSYYIRYGIS